MAIITYYNALGSGASINGSDFISVPTNGVVVDGDPYVSQYDYNTWMFTWSYNFGDFYATAFITDVGTHPYYYIESLYYADANLNSLVDVYGVNIRFNINDDFSSGAIFTNLFAGNDTITGNRYADSINAGRGNDKVNGLNGADKLYGAVGNDSLNGGSGNDLLVGGTGKDVMNGGTGRDRFDFNAVNESVTTTNRDVINGFDAYDVIDVSSIDAKTMVVGSQAFTFSRGADFNGTFNGTGKLFYETDTHILWGNNDGDAQADFSIKVNFSGISNLTSADFIL